MHTSQRCSARVLARAGSTLLPRLGVTLALVATLGIAQGERTGRRYDVSGLRLLSQATDRLLPIESPPLRDGPVGDAAAAHAHAAKGDSAVQTDPSDLMPLLHRVLGTPRGADDPSEPRLDGDTLHLRLTDDGDAKIQLLLESLREVFAATASVDLFEIPPAAAATAERSLLDAKAVAALLAAAKPTRVHHLNARFGVVTAIEAVSRRAFIRDYDVDVAGGSTAADPQVDVLVTGFRGVLRVEPTFDARFAVAIHASHSHETAPPRQHAVHFTDDGAIEMPTVAWSCSGASATVSDGGGILLGNDQLEHGLWLIRVGSAQNRPPAQIAGLDLLPIGPIVLPCLRQFFHDRLTVTASGMSTAAEAEDESDQARAEWTSIAEDALPAKAVEAGTASITRLAGVSCVVDGDEASRQQATALLKKLNAAASRTVDVDVRAGFVDAATAIGPGDAPLDLAAIAAQLPLHFRTCGRSQDRVALGATTLSSYLQDMNVEIAERAAIGDPIVGIQQTGLRVQLSLAPAPGNRWVSVWSLEFAVPQAMGHGAASRPETGPLDLPQVTGTSAAGTNAFTSGQWVELQRCSLPGSEKVFVALMRITE